MCCVLGLGLGLGLGMLCKMVHTCVLCVYVCVGVFWGWYMCGWCSTQLTHPLSDRLYCMDKSWTCILTKCTHFKSFLSPSSPAPSPYDPFSPKGVQSYSMKILKFLQRLISVMVTVWLNNDSSYTCSLTWRAGHLLWYTYTYISW